MKDDMFPLYDEIVKSDAIVVGAVVYLKKQMVLPIIFLKDFFLYAI